MRQVERQGVQLRGIPAIIQQSVEVIVDNAEKDKVRHPAAPIELTYQTAVYLDTNSRSRVRFLMDFPDVVFNTDGTPATIQQYELWAREETASALNLTSNSVPSQALPGATLPGLASTVSNEQIAAEEKPWVMRDTSVSSFFRTDGFIPGSVWRFRARAIGVSTVTPGEWSDELVVQMLADTTPPQQTTAPKVTASRGQLTVTWDGQGVSGAMPPDFKYAILAHGITSSPTFEIARFGRGGGFKVVTDLEYYDPQFFRLRAVDESGNMGPWSEQAVGFTTPLVDKDIILSTIDAAKTHLKNINAGVSILPNTIITEHLVVTEEMTAAIANFLVVNADMINVNSIWGDEAFFGMADALLFRGDAFEGKSFTGGIFTGGRFQNSVEEYSGFKIDPSGILGYAPGGTGVETFRLDAATGSLTANSGTLTGLKYQTHIGATQGIKIEAGVGIRSYDNSNRINFEVTPNGATFTGKVTSGFGSAKAVLTDAVHLGRPGVQIVTGSSYYSEPFIVSFSAADPSPGNRGALYASAAWTSSGANPGRLIMGADGSWSIGGTGGYVGTMGTTMGLLLRGDDTSNAPELQLGDNVFLKTAGSYGGTPTMQLSGNGEAMLRATGGQPAWLQANGGQNYLRVQPSGNLILHRSQIWFEMTDSGTAINGGLQVYGTKNFVMKHPTREGMELLHGATESPVSGVEYWGHGVVGADGTDVIELPEYFEALVKPDGREAYIAGRGAVLDWSDVIDGKVSVYGNTGTKYSWLVK
jgi:hypothetical protein